MEAGMYAKIISCIHDPIFYSETTKSCLEFELNVDCKLVHLFLCDGMSSVKWISVVSVGV